MFAVFTLAAPISDNDELVNIIILEANDAEQQQCFTAAIKKTWENNPDLDRWFRELTQLHEKYIKDKEACQKLPEKDAPWVTNISFIVVFRSNTLL